MSYSVRIFEMETWRVDERRVDAASAGDAQAQCLADGVVVLSVRRTETSRVTARSDAGFDVAWWCRELRTLIRAGMTVVEALETLQEQQREGSPRSQVQHHLLDALRQGRPLSVAMAAQDCFPGLLVAGVRASERTSALAEALEDYLQYHDVLARLRKQVVSAALYPAVVVVLGAAITLFLLVYVMPRFSGLYNDAHASASAATGGLLGLSRWLAAHGPLVAFAIGCVLGALLFAWRSGVALKGLMWIVEASAPLRRQVDHLRLAMVYQSLTLMFRGGYALDDALKQCATLRLGTRWSEAVSSARDGLQRGERVSQAFQRAGLTDAVSLRLLAVGERSGQFEHILQTIAERHAEQFTTFVDRVGRLVEPLLLMLVALVVGAIVVLMYMPIFDIATSIRT